MQNLQTHSILLEEGECVMLNQVIQPTDISESITKNWTEQAIECYKLNGNCKECSIRKAHYSFACQMPRVVEVLKLINGETELD